MIPSADTVGLELKAALRTQRTDVQVVKFSFEEPPNVLFQTSGDLYVGLCLKSQHQSARGCFTNLRSANSLQRMGDLFVFPPGVTMRAFSNECSPLLVVLCTIGTEVLAELLERSSDFADPACIAQTDAREPRVRQLLLSLREEVTSPSFGSEFAVDALAVQIALELFRSAKRKINRTQGGLAAWQLKTIDERLAECVSPPTLAELAQLCRLSVRQLSRAFRVSCGRSIGAYVTQKQLEHAKKLLESDLSVAAIAAKLGFVSSSSFCFAFRRATGMTPGECRQRTCPTLYSSRYS